MKRVLRWLLWHTARFDGVERPWWNRLAAHIDGQATP